MDKTKVLDLRHAKLALETLAHYHGSWWKFLRTKPTEKNEFFQRKDVEVIFDNYLPAIIFKGMIDKTAKSIEKLLRNEGVQEEIIKKYE